MTCRRKLAVASIVGAVVALFGLYECGTFIIWDGSVPITVTVHSKSGRSIRDVTWDHFGSPKEVDLVLQYPRENAPYFREAWVLSGSTFTVNLPTSGRSSPFRLRWNSYSWRPFAVFRIEFTEGLPAFVSAVIRDVRTTRDITVDVP